MNGEAGGEMLQYYVQEDRMVCMNPSQSRLIRVVARRQAVVVASPPGTKTLSGLIHYRIRSSFPLRTRVIKKGIFETYHALQMRKRRHHFLSCYFPALLAAWHQIVNDTGRYH